ncbi:hypothetical protein J3D46_002172 [Paenarthrobacter sp. A20]|nr:hypothetical protein [Paenarthrobacter sp. A20]
MGFFAGSTSGRSRGSFTGCLVGYPREVFGCLTGDAALPTAARRRFDFCGDARLTAGIPDPAHKRPSRSL